MNNYQLLITKYPFYKDSEVEWLGEVPEHWEIVRNKQIFKERNILSSTGKENLLTVSHITGVTPRSEKNVNMFMAETMEGYKICHQGDLIINTMWAWMGALGTSNYFGICSPAYNVYMPLVSNSYNYQYFDYFFRTPNTIVEMTRNSKGIVSSRLRLYAKEFFQIQVPLPPLSEQKAIANYLDTQTAQLDRKIDLLTQKVTLYRNLKQSLINETVTRGLDKSVPMKDSGVEWIGEVPEHWEVCRVKNIVKRIGNGVTPRGGSEVYIDSGIPFLRSQNVYDDGLRLENVSFIPVKIHDDMKNSQLKVGDILINITGASIGRSCIVPVDLGVANINQHIAFLRIKHWFNAFYISLFFKSSLAKNYIQIEQSGASKEAFNLGQIANVLLVLPPLLEQKAIADYLDTKTAQIDKIIQTINTQIEKLKELRKTLINDVVTGKIKVI